jgi:hypothetical protein
MSPADELSGSLVCYLTEGFDVAAFDYLEVLTFLVDALPANVAPSCMGDFNLCRVSGVSLCVQGRT